MHAWVETFGEVDGVEVHESDFFAHDAHAMVSPANSFGIMDGGLDAAIRSELGGTLQTDVQKMIVDNHHGEMPVGTAEVVPTTHKRWPFLVVAPTMRVPESVANTLNAYLAFRAALLAVNRHNASSNDVVCRTVPGATRFSRSLVGAKSTGPPTITRMPIRAPSRLNDATVG